MDVVEVRVRRLIVHGVMLGGAGVLWHARTAIGTGAGAVGASSTKAIACSIEPSVLQCSVLQLRACLLGSKLSGNIGVSLGSCTAIACVNDRHRARKWAAQYGGQYVQSSIC